MNQAKGKVISVSGAGHRRLATVDVEASGICPRCAEGKGCGAGVFGARQSTRRLDALVPSDAEIHAGDEVQVVLEPQDLLAAATIVYGWPLLGAALGAALAYVADYGDAIAAAAALGGMASAALLARRRLKRSQCVSRFTPRIIV